VGDPVREHPRLARPGTGDDEQRPAAVDDRIELIGIEPGECSARLLYVCAGVGLIGHESLILRIVCHSRRGRRHS
jgi:hypothetical protein